MFKALQIAIIIILMSKKELKAFGRRVKELRIERDLTQSELAEKVGLSNNFIGMVERGERNTSVDKIFKLAKAFDIKLAQFFETL